MTFFNFSNSFVAGTIDKKLKKAPSALSSGIDLSTMTYFNAPLGVVNPYIHSPLGTPVSKEVNSMKSGYMDDITFILARLEGCFPYDSGSLHHNDTGCQYKGGPVSTFPPR
jgi:hypothetical protein